MMYIIQAGIELLETELITIIRKLRSIMNFKIADLGKAVFENQVIIDADD